MYSKLLCNSPYLRQKCFKLFESNIWIPKYGLNLIEERNCTFDKLKSITENNLIDVHDFKSNPSNIFDIHEYVGYIDGSTATKMTAQFNLFGGTIKNFGSEKHKEFLDKVNTLENIGCFAFTEKGYGNNAFKMETTLTYNKYDETIIINSPTLASEKSWITNSVCHANYAVVFGQLIVDNINYGPHPVLVKIRDDYGNILNNVTITDMGLKLGLNGVDNGIIKFDNFVADANLLGGNISKFMDDGTFFTSNMKKREKFINFTDQLVSGRVCISSMMLGCTKALLNNTYKYADKRFGVGLNGDSNMKIIDYGVQRNTIVPLLVRTIGFNLLLNEAKDLYRVKNDDKLRDELMTVACSLKPMLAWHTQEVVTKCRELTGGEGFKIANQFGEGFAGACAGITAEGDSKVLMMKTCMERIKKNTQNMTFSNYIKLGTKKHTSFGSFSVDNLFFNKEEIILSELMTKINKDNYFEITMQSHAHLLQNAGKAYCEKKIYDKFEQVEKSNEYNNISENIRDMKKYFLLDCVTRDPLWYSENSLTNLSLRNVTKEKLKLEKKIGDSMSEIINSFELPESIIHAPMAKYK